MTEDHSTPSQGEQRPSEMVERVARAMWQGEWDRAKAHERAANEAAGRNVYVSYVPRWEDCDLIFLGYARAAIEAMREPTEEMEEAADDPFHAAWKHQRERSLRLYGKEAYASYPFSTSMWKAMIDSALSTVQGDKT